jgi:pimeloyl-ACP methyl ester carboxylesterase
MDKTAFPVGLHPLHQDVSMNFQMNRWFSWVGEPGMLDEMRSVAPRITNYVDLKREFLALAENAKREGHVLRAGFYFRAADFFMRTDDPDRRNARGQFLSAMRSIYGLDQLGRHEVRYAAEGVAGFLPAYRFTPSRSMGTIVFFGGFDSYIEELTSAFFYLRDAGYEVIAFEGPGQGGALNDAGLHMTAAWHRPVKAVLDHFKLDHVTLAGLSMGGCLVMRAAAFEPRVDRVVAYDVYPDALDTTLRQVNTVQRVLLKILLKLRAARAVNAVARRAARNHCAVGPRGRHARDGIVVAERLFSKHKDLRDRRCLNADQTRRSVAGGKRRPPGPDGALLSADRDAQKRTLDHGSALHDQRERREPLPGWKLRVGIQDDRQLAGWNARA